MGSAVLDLPIEALSLLILNKDEEIQKQCFEYILLLTGEPDKCKDLYENSNLLLAVIKATSCPSYLFRPALVSLINIASSEEGATSIFEVDMENSWKSNSVLAILNHSINRNYEFAEFASNILTNMTTWEKLALKVAKVFTSKESSFGQVFEAVHNKNYNARCPNLSQHFCQLFGNLAQSVEFQKYLLTAEDGLLFCSILPLINNGETVLQKRGIISTIYNCLFNRECHSILLNPPFNILSSLLYPLAGPEEFDEDEVEKMPIDLQYLGSEKERESDPATRKLLLKSLLMLCDTKYGRSFLRDQQTYLILREYHKWEKDLSLTLACENVVDILIRTEEEIGIENFSSLEVPDNLINEFEKIDADFIQDSSSS